MFLTICPPILLFGTILFFNNKFDRFATLFGLYVYSALKSTSSQVNLWGHTKNVLYKILYVLCSSNMYCVMCVLYMQYYALLLYEMSLLKECTLLKKNTIGSHIVEERLNYIPIYKALALVSFIITFKVSICNYVILKTRPRPKPDMFNIFSSPARPTNFCRRPGLDPKPGPCRALLHSTYRIQMLHMHIFCMKVAFCIDLMTP